MRVGRSSGVARTDSNSSGAYDNALLTSSSNEFYILAPIALSSLVVTARMCWHPMTKHAAVTTVNYAGRSSQLQHKMVKALPLSIAVGTLLLAPIWVQHLVSKDGGLIAIGGGKLSEEDLFGDGKKKKGMHPIVFHLTAVAGIAHFALSFMAIAATYYGDKMVKKAITAIYAVWVACIMIVQYTHRGLCRRSSRCSRCLRRSFTSSARWSHSVGTSTARKAARARPPGRRRRRRRRRRSERVRPARNSGHHKGGKRAA